MTTHVLERVREGDRWAWYCTCGKFLAYNPYRAITQMDDHLEHDVTADPLTELALSEAKQRHPSRREWVPDDQVTDQ